MTRQGTRATVRPRRAERPAPDRRARRVLPIEAEDHFTAASRRRRIGRGAAAVAVGVMLNAAIFAALAGLNREAEHPVESEPAEPRRVFVAELSPERAEAPEPTEAAPDPPTAEPEPMSVEPEWAPPDVEAPAPAAFDLPLEAPAVRVSPVRVAVAERAAESRSDPGEPAPGPAAVMRGDRVDQPPRELAGPAPRYPRIAQRRGVEGSVRVNLLIDESGRVERAEVIEVEGHAAFRQAVLDVIDRVRFEPARHEGRAVRVWQAKVFRFVIE